MRESQSTVEIYLEALGSSDLHTQSDALHRTESRKFRRMPPVVSTPRNFSNSEYLCGTASFFYCHGRRAARFFGP